MPISLSHLIFVYMSWVKNILVIIFKIRAMEEATLDETLYEISLDERNEEILDD